MRKLLVMSPAHGARCRAGERGFSLIELMMVLAIFLVISGAVFELLNAAQIRYRAEQEFLESFTGARLGVEMMVRDIHNAGYPTPYTYAGNYGQPPTPLTYPAGTWEDPLAAPAQVQRRFAIGILGITAGGAMSTTCTVNGGLTPCAIPSPWDLVLELDVDPENSGALPTIEWVRYNLTRPGGETTSTLFRTVNTKDLASGPTLNPSNVPFVEEVVQNPNLAVAANNPALFTYECDPSMVLVGTTNVCTAEHVKNVYIALQVQSVRPDIQTQQLRQITVRGMSSRQYPSR
jgi:prepilin-type N-terminal cleavage/methylation domain-containing protein